MWWGETTRMFSSVIGLLIFSMSASSCWLWIYEPPSGIPNLTVHRMACDESIMEGSVLLKLPLLSFFIRARIVRVISDLRSHPLFTSLFAHSTYPWLSGCRGLLRTIFVEGCLWFSRKKGVLLLNSPLGPNLGPMKRYGHKEYSRMSSSQNIVVDIVGWEGIPKILDYFGIRKWRRFGRHSG